MIESSPWSSMRDESICKAAGAAYLRRYGQFFEKLSEIHTGENSSFTYIVEGPIRLLYKVSEDIGLLSLAETENKTYTKILATVTSTCREARLLKTDANKFYAKLFTHGERCADCNDCKIDTLLSDLQDLSMYTNRISTVIHLIIRQLSSSANNSHREIYLPLLMESLIDLLTILITFDEVLDAQHAIQEKWKKYRVQVRSVIHNSSQMCIREERIFIFEKMLKDLQGQLLSKNLFLKALDNVMNINKSFTMYDHLMCWLKTTMTDVENKSNDAAAANKNWIRVNIGIVVVMKLFGTCDKKLIKRMSEINKKLYAVTLVGNVLLVPGKLLADCLPRETAVTLPPNVGEKVLLGRTQKLPTVVNALVQRAMTWCIDMQYLAINSDQLISSRIDKKRALLVDIVTIMRQINEHVSLITNIHAALAKPMRRSTVELICQLVQMQKSLEVTFHTLGPVIVQSQNQVLQQLTWQILMVLETVKKGLTSTDKGYSRERLDALSLIKTSMRVMNGSGSADRRLVVRTALGCASQLTESFKEDELAKLRVYLDTYDTIVELHNLVAEACDYSVLIHHQSMLPAYFSSVTGGNSTLGHLVHLLEAFNSAIFQQEPSELLETKITEQKKTFVRNVLEPACREIETSLRLHVHAHLKLDSTNPFKVGAKDAGRIIRSPPLPIGDGAVINAKRYVEHYLDYTFYNLTTIALHDWKTYRIMHALAHFKLGLETVQDHLPTQTLEQGLDALEIMRNIHVFVSKYLYNLHSQTFIEHTSANKHLNTIGIRHIANSIRTHGTGIISTTVNFVYQFLRVKLTTFSQFLFDEHIKSRLMRDIRFIRSQREKGATPYTLERAEKFQTGIRKLGMTSDGQSYLDQFRQLITQIGNALGYVRLIRSGGLHASSNAISFLPDINSSAAFESTCAGLNFSESTVASAKRLEEDVANLVRNFTEGIQYFKLLVDVFASAFRDGKSHHLQQFYAIIPPLTLSFVDNAVSNKEKLFKKNKTGAAFTDDGFAMGVAYIIALLDQNAEVDGLEWFNTVQEFHSAEKDAAEGKADLGDEKLQQTRALTLKRLEERSAEFKLLYYSLSGARVFFKQPDA